MTAIPELAKKALDSVVKTVVPDESPPKLDSRRLLILLHGEKASDDLVRAAITRLRNEGHQVSVRVTYEAGDTDRLVKEALLLGTADTLVAAGGDGTVNEVVAALLTHTGGLKDTRDISDPPEPLVQARGRPPALDKVSVGILPMGTSNDFAATTGIPEDPYEALLLATQASHLRRIDVGLLNGQVFMNTATVGASADIGKITGSGIKKLLGPFAFLVTGMRAVTSWRPVASVMRFPNIKESAHHYKQQPKQNAQGELLSQTLGQAVPHVTAHVAAPSGSAEPVTPPAGARIIPSSSLGDMSPGGQSWTPVAQDTLQSVPVTPVVTPSATPAAKAAASETGSAVGELQGVPLLHVSAANNRQVASMVSISPNAVLDDGMLDLVYVTGDLGARVRRVLFDLIFKGPTKTKVVSTLLRVPWLEIASSEPLEWSLDGEAMPQPATNFRFSLLHRAVYVHLPDDRMLVAGQPEPEAEGATLCEDKQHKPKGQLRLPNGKLRPPTLAAMLSSVVKFRKKKNWGAALRGGAVFTLKFLVAASVGGAVAHWWHTRGDTHAISKNEDKDTDKKGKGIGKDAKRGRRRRNVVIADVPVLAPCPP